jgi:hypothetical protein
MMLEADPFPSRKEIPLRALGGNVLLRKVAMDVHLGQLVIFNAGGGKVLQVGEVVGLGGRWTQDRPWQPPMPAIRPVLMEDGSVDPNWKPPDLSRMPQIQPARFDQRHIERLDTLKVGDLVVYTQARAYDVFNWKGEDILVYPGNWIHGRVEESSINDPSKRRYLLDNFDTEAPDRKLHG